jgi:RimJ/RimL family protein N-acetyltransferase
MWLEEIELVSASIKLVPLRVEHANSLISAASDGDLWDLWFTGVPNEESINEYIQHALSEQSKGLALPFVVVDKTSNKIIGSTRFCNAVPSNQRVEIGYTWYSNSFQRTSVNTECKNLLLSHAFDSLGAIAVEFRTHWHNQCSRQAISRLGAKQDGVLRNHQRMPDGSFRDTVVFSIINIEWPTVKLNLNHKLLKYG